MRESKVEAHLVKRVEETGGIIRKVQWIGRRGAPDRWCGWPSTKRRSWVELKGDNGRLSVHQQREHARLKSCGEEVWSLWTIEQVDAYVEEMVGWALPNRHK